MTEKTPHLVQQLVPDAAVSWNVEINGVVSGRKLSVMLKLAKVEVAVKKGNALLFQTLKDMSLRESGGLRLSKGR